MARGHRGAPCHRHLPADGMGMWVPVLGDGRGFARAAVPAPAGGMPRTPSGTASSRALYWDGSVSPLRRESREEPRRGVTSAVPRTGDGTFPVPARRRFSTSRDPTAFPGGRATLFTHHT